MRIPIVILTLLALTSFAPATSATIDTCTTPAFPGGPSTITGLIVTDVRAYKDGSCGGTGVVGGSLPTSVPPCATAGTYVVPGGYCGIVVPASGVITCHWFPLVSTANFITVGFDVNNDGHIWPTDGKAFTLANPLTDYTLVNPHSVPARVIAYPTHTAPVQSFGDLTLVECV